MTTYTLRKGSPAKTRTDLVVIGVARTGKGALVACPGAEDVAEAYGRRFKPLLSSMGFKGDDGEVLRLPAGEAIRASQLLVIGLGPATRLTLDKVRRAAGVAARNLRNAASVALALPGRRRRARGRRGRGLPARGCTPSPAYKSGRDESAVADVAILSDAARRQDAIAALEDARAVDELVRVTRDWVNTPPNDLPPATFAESARSSPTSAGRGAASRGVEVEVLGPEELEELGCGGILGVGQGSHQRAAAGQAHLGARGAARSPRAGRQGRHLRLRRAQHQVGQLDGRHEVRHGRSRGRHRGHLRDRRPRPARSA